MKEFEPQTFHWNEIIFENRLLLAENLYESFHELLTVSELREKPVDMLFISFLRTSIIDKYPLYCLTLTDESGWEDIHTIRGYWDISCVSELIYSTYPLSTEVTGKGLKDYETEAQWIAEAENLHQKLKNQISDIVNCSQAVNNKCYSKLHKIKFGEFLSCKDEILVKVEREADE